MGDRPGPAGPPKNGNGQARKAARKRRRRRFWRWVGLTLLVLLIVGTGAVAYTAKYVYETWQDLPEVNAESASEWALSSVIYDRNGKELHELHAGEMRTPVKLRDVPQHVLDAFVAIEDARFRQHWGIDPIRILGAAWHDVKVFARGSGDIQGASTITQQLAKNAFLTHDQTMARKVKEALLAVQLERHLSKDEILERYLNEVWFGQSYYGLGTAAKVYFGKEPQQLTVAEGAMLAGMVKNPYRFDPYSNMDEARERMELVLGQMVKYGYLADSEAEEARDQKFSLPGLPSGATRVGDFNGDDFVDYVINVLLKQSEAERYGLKAFSDQELFNGGYRIYTTLDPTLQALADEAVATVMSESYEANQFAKDMVMTPDAPEEWVQAGVVIMEPKSGEVKALVGGRGPRKGMRQLNRATDTLRQPGSTFKPIAAYVPAVEELGYGPGTVIDDSAWEYHEKEGQLWPDNYDHKYGGLTPLRVGLYRSINAMAVRLIGLVGPEKSLAYAEKLGINSLVHAPQQPNDQNLATALGGVTRGVSLLELTHAYGVLANMGLRVDPVVITRIEDREGNIIYAARPRRQQVIKQSTAYLVTEMLKDVIRRGTGNRNTGGFNNWPVAGKTGTTEENTDAWFIGYTRDVVAGVWNGYDNRDKKRTLRYTGSGVPVQVWDYIMKRIVTTEPPDWERPPDVVAAEICTKTGLLPSPYCPTDQRRTELFAKGYVPKQFDDAFWTTASVVPEMVAGADGKETQAWRLWRPGCAALPESRAFLVRPDYVKHPDPAKQWAPRFAPQDIGMMTPWEYCTPVTVGPPPPDPGDSEPGGGEPGGDSGWLFPIEPIVPPIQPPGQ